MSAFKIEQILSQKAFSNEHGTFVNYEVQFSGEQGIGTAIHRRKSSSPAPKEGEIIDGQLVHKGGNVELKRIWKDSVPSKSFGGKNPQEKAEIRRMASQKVAVQLLDIQARVALASNTEPAKTFLARLSDPERFPLVLESRIDWFMADVERAGQEA